MKKLFLLHILCISNDLFIKRRVDTDGKRIYFIWETRFCNLESVREMFGVTLCDSFRGSSIELLLLFFFGVNLMLTRIKVTVNKVTGNKCCTVGRTSNYPTVSKYKTLT